MNTGMLWLDTDKQRSLEEKVMRAAAYYEAKYGQRPELCLVNRSALSAEKQVSSIQVRPAANIIAHHFLLGMDRPLSEPD
jgi:hypothetical protein